MTPPTVWCAACRRARSPLEVIETWRVGRPDEIVYVCRPSVSGDCFRRYVPPADHVSIAATPEMLADLAAFFENGGTWNHPPQPRPRRRPEPEPWDWEAA